MGEHSSRTIRLSTGIPGIILLATSVLISFSCARLYIWPKYGRFGDAELGRYFVTAASFIAVPFLVITGLLLLRSASESAKCRQIGWLLTGSTVIAMLVPVGFIGYSMRPLPTYDSRDFQHLIGRTLQDARSELDTRHSVSGFGSGKGGVYSETLSLHGIQILADRDGVIFEVNKR